MCSKSHALTLGLSQSDISHDFKDLNMKMLTLFLTSQHYIFEKMEHKLEVKSVLCFLEHLLFIRSFSCILPEKKINGHLKMVFVFHLVINILSDTCQPLLYLLITSYQNRK